MNDALGALPIHVALVSVEGTAVEVVQPLRILFSLLFIQLLLAFALHCHCFAYFSSSFGLELQNRLFTRDGGLVGRHRVPQVVVVGAAMEARPLAEDRVVDHDAIHLTQNTKSPRGIIYILRSHSHL